MYKRQPSGIFLQGPTAQNVLSRLSHDRCLTTWNGEAFGNIGRKGETMAEDFYDFTSAKINSLSNTEKQIFNFVVRNMHLVKNMSIRDLAAACFVSTTTLFLFVKKLGFSGYSEFTAMIRLTERTSKNITIPNVISKKDYQEDYLKNVIEAVKVISNDKIDLFNRIMDRYPVVYILSLIHI